MTVQNKAAQDLSAEVREKLIQIIIGSHDCRELQVGTVVFIADMARTYCYEALRSERAKEE